MRKMTLLLGALAAGAVASAVPAIAGIGTNVSYGGGDQKPCRFYIHHDLPAPKHCYRAFYDVYGPQVIVRGGMVFQDREAFGEFRKRDGFRVYDRWAERQEYRERREYDSRLAETTGRSRGSDDADEEQASGGASYGHRSETAEPASGGATYGHRMERPQPYSGGASGY
ncbi:MAG: hypothetical protein JOY77_00325 [Alphaproteobacteria bacterium]|nr:hypothetical protein [Alphaproteobacteria bacterium]MBV9061359.1 hypothetical protein [Alphaproteobacteria bacterium]